MTKPITDYTVIRHGVCHVQFFQGEGVAFSDWKESVTGSGSTARRAYEDACENLAHTEWDINTLNSAEDEIPDEENETLPEDAHEELCIYVTIKVK